LIVVHAGEGADIAALAARFPSIGWMLTNARTTDSDLRRIGIERATRDIVLFVDDRDWERCEWIATLCVNWRSWKETGGRVISAPICSDRSNCYPILSVVMPVRNGGPPFLMALQGLALSDLPRSSWELVIVDDGSTDESTVVAAQYADKLLRLRPGPRGPGYARNRGFELTLGEYTAFVNADVMVETNTLSNALTLLMQHPEIGAVFGSCGAPPTSAGFLSQYRSLVQRYYHRAAPDDAPSFSSACGVVRSSVFGNAGGYDEWHFSRRQLEDLELGQRIRGLGERIVLQPDIRAAHLRKWTLRRMIATEIFDRAVPWMRLVRRQLTRDRRAQTNRTAKRVNVVASWLAILCAVLAWTQQSASLALAAAACVSIVLVNNASELAFIRRERGLAFASASFPLDMFYYLIAGVGILFGWIARQAVGDPTPGAVAEAYAEMGVKRWPPVPVRRVARSSFPSDSAIASTVSGRADLPVTVHPPKAQERPRDSSQPLQ
jgi:glycosyltransferase involved in cell wall biosynthesis